MSELATRLCGSNDLYAHNGRRPVASVNFVTAHDGFTLHDLVSYNGKHNEANGEDNRDGHDDNLSWNCGAEGPTDDPAILELRERQKRNFLATLLISQGIPMILAGDEIGRTQQGNNNGYCQDNEISWVHWDLDARDTALLEFTRKLIRCFRAHPNLRRYKWFQGRGIRGTDAKDIVWWRADGKEMSDEDWASGWLRALGLRLDGASLDIRDQRYLPTKDDTLLILLNAHHEPVPFILPAFRSDVRWGVVFDTARPDLKEGEQAEPGGGNIALAERSVMLLAHVV
jgi:glycogen operon protein